MSRIANSWQGSLRSTSTSNSISGMKPAGENLPSKAINAKGGKVARAGTRSALGDISNRTNNANNGLGFRAVKKTGPGFSKPFSIAQQDERKFSGRTSIPDNSMQDDVDMEMDVDMEVENDENMYIEQQLSIHQTPLPEIDRSDVNDLHNPKYAAEYVNDIYAHYREIEGKYLPDPSYMEHQTDINSKMRALLIDWLIQVHVKFKLLPQTLYLTVNVLDRFLQKKVVPRRKLQLVGCAAMLVASKYEEIYAPECADFVKMSDKAFTTEELLKMESILVNVLEFHLTTPSPYTFLRRYMKVACSTAKTQHFATYLVERSLQEYDMLRFKPSMIAASSLNIAQALTNDRRAWGSTLVRHSGYTEEMLLECTDTMKKLYSTNQKNYLQAVNKKYSCSKYMHVSLISLE